MRGVEAELNGGLIGGLPEVSEEVTNGFFTVVEDVAGGGAVHGRGDVVTELFKLVAEGGEKSVWAKGW